MENYLIFIAIYIGSCLLAGIFYMLHIRSKNFFLDCPFLMVVTLICLGLLIGFPFFLGVLVLIMMLYLGPAWAGAIVLPLCVLILYLIKTIIK